MMSMSALESVHNYYERYVIQEINENYLHKGLSDQQVADLACIALNRIPPKYIRYDIDMSFYMSSDEYVGHQQKIQKAVAKAFKKLVKLDSISTKKMEDDA